MHSRVTTVDAYAFGLESSSAAPPAVSRRRNASWTMSSASLTLPSMR